MSLFNSLQEYNSNATYNGINYYNDRQQLGTQKPKITAGVMNGISSREQQRFSRLSISILGQSPKVMSQLASSLGQGSGIVFPSPAPGTKVSILSLGNQQFVLGSETKSVKPDSVYSLNLAKDNPGNTLPSALAPIVAEPQSYRAVSGLVTLSKKDKSIGLNTFSIIPGALSFTSWQTGKRIELSPTGITNVFQHQQNLNLSLFASHTDELTFAANLAKSVKAWQHEIEGDQYLHLIDPLTSKNQAFKEILSKRDRETAYRLNKVKSEFLTDTTEKLTSIFGAELVRDKAYPFLQEIAKSTWANGILKSIFNLEASILDNPTVQQISGILGQINKALPFVNKLVNIIAPANEANTGLNFLFNGAAFNPQTLTIKPDYSQTIALINKYLPTEYKLKYEDDVLTLGSFTAYKGVSFPFTPKFKQYVESVNNILPKEVDWVWGLGNPPKVIIIAKGIVINSNLGLIVQDDALEIERFIKEAISCPVPKEAEVTVAVVDNQITQIGSNSNFFSDAFNFVSDLATQAGKYLKFENGSIGLKFDALGQTVQDSINSILPGSLRLSLDVSPDGSIKNSSLGPINFSRKKDGGWDLAVPSITNLESGVNVIGSLGVLPPDITYLANTGLQLKGLFEEVQEAYKSPTNPNIKVSEKVPHTIDYVTGELKPPYFADNISGSYVDDDLVEGSEGDDLEDSQIWDDPLDVTQTISTKGGLQAEVVETFTHRSLDQTIFQPLIKIGESIFGGKSNSDPYNSSLFGRSDAGLSLSSGQIQTNTGTNYALLNSLCIDNGDLLAETEPNVISDLPTPANPIDIPIISGLENSLDVPATSPALVVDDAIDPQSNRDNLEALLISLGLGDVASEALDASDQFLFPPLTRFFTATEEFDDGSDKELIIFVEEIPNTNNAVDTDITPIDPNLNPSVFDFIEVIQAIGDLPTQQILGGLITSSGISNPEIEIAKIVKRRISFRLDCDSTSFYEESLVKSAVSEDFPLFASDYGLTLSPASEYITNPLNLLDILQKTEPKLVPVAERLLLGDLFGFYQQLLWAKANTDIYKSPLEWVRLQTLVRSYYGGAIAGSNPAKTWLDQLASI